MTRRRKNPNNSFGIDEDKWRQFKQWCIGKNLDASLVIETLIDACLNEDKAVLGIVINGGKPLVDQDKLEEKFSNSLREIIRRIERLEASLSTSSLQPITSPSPPPVSLSHKEEEVVYISRQEVWQILKKTDYVKYAGYDSFLKAKGHEFAEYGIFYDPEKKRFYILREENNNKH
ncbi:MAG: hypothetical protein N3D76_11415 [Geminocystis sp.]|nr:hypothetical protein [Geminocystis sp.]HIK38396.1 hypothetical protein [Geminocystis sp. M7585_C2015_104]